MNLDYKEKGDDVEPIEKKELLIHFTNLGNIYTQESTTLHIAWCNRWHSLLIFPQ